MCELSEWVNEGMGEWALEPEVPRPDPWSVPAPFGTITQPAARGYRPLGLIYHFLALGPASFQAFTEENVHAGESHGKNLAGAN